MKTMKLVLYSMYGVVVMVLLPITFIFTGIGFVAIRDILRLDLYGSGVFIFIIPIWLIFHIWLSYDIWKDWDINAEY